MKSERFQAFMPALAFLSITGFALAVPTEASAAQRHKHLSHPGVVYSHAPSRGGYQALVSDGPGTGFGFHRLPLPYHVAAVHAHDRQSDALRSTVAIDALTSGNFHSGYLGNSVYGYGNGAAYGVFNGADGYGSPYFAGYYGEGGGTDYGPFGHAYTN